MANWSKNNTGKPDQTDIVRSSVDLIAERIDNVEDGLSGDDALTTVDINGGTIDGTPIGVTTPDSAEFTDLTASSTVTSTLVASGDCQLGATFQDWTNSGYIKNTVYQATTDLFVCAFGYMSTDGGGITGYTDSNSSPTEVVQQVSVTSSGDQYGSIFFPVRKGDYWKVTATDSVTIKTLAFGI